MWIKISRKTPLFGYVIKYKAEKKNYAKEVMPSDFYISFYYRILRSIMLINDINLS